ncbi:MAG: FtsW/RodA/SpoVE family cell cycle protein [Phycisphaerales bacterium]|nr:FtsW/RodA/SpoVE family cell cycle protein [Phycisphaerales bacterium]
MIRAGNGLILAVLALLVFGVVMVTSAGLTVGQETPLTIKQIVLGRTTILALAAFAAMLIAAALPLKRIQAHIGNRSMLVIVTCLFALLLLVFVPGLGRSVNGARRWIEIGPIGFQPSEVAKWTVIMFIAWFAARNVKSLHRFTTGSLLPMILVMLICGLIALEDLGTAVLIAVTTLMMLLIAGAPWKHVLAVGPIAIVGFFAALIASPYRIERLRAFIDPYQDPEGIGYHVIQSVAAVGGGGLAGRGLGHSIQKFGYLPEDTTDFVFAIICEELGLLGCLAVIGLYLLLLGCGLAIVKRTSDLMLRLLGIGILLCIAIQASMNMLVVTGMVPTKGIALPLLSAGGTGWILTAFCLGLIVAIERCCETTRSKAISSQSSTFEPEEQSLAQGA